MLRSGCGFVPRTSGNEAGFGTTTRELIGDQDQNDDRAESRRMWRQAVNVGAVGIEMGAAVFIGYLAGLWADNKLGTTWLWLLGLLLGVGAAGKALWNTARKVSKDETR